MATIRFFLVLLCLVGVCRGTVAGSGVVMTGQRGLLRRCVSRNDGKGSEVRVNAVVSRVVMARNEATSGILDIARSQLGVREKTGHNDGVEVEGYLKYVGFGKGNHWCAAFVSWCFWKAGYREPKTAWSPALFPAGRTLDPSQALDDRERRNEGYSLRRDDWRTRTGMGAQIEGLVFGIYFPELKRVAHCGLVEKKQGEIYQTIEGNTNSEGGREGNGVFRRLRHRRTIRVFADWLSFAPRNDKKRQIR